MHLGSKKYVREEPVTLFPACREREPLHRPSLGTAVECTHNSGIFGERLALPKSVRDPAKNLMNCRGYQRLPEVVAVIHGISDKSLTLKGKDCAGHVFRILPFEVDHPTQIPSSVVTG
jgi:hypothetical protein